MTTKTLAKREMEIGSKRSVVGWRKWETMIDLRAKERGGGARKARTQKF